MEDKKAQILAKAWRKINNAKRERTKKFDEEIAKLNDDQKVIENELLALCSSIGCSSIKTDFGTITRSVKQTYVVNDWFELNKFIMKNEALELLQRRVHESNMRSFLEDNPNLHPAGLDKTSEYIISVRKPQS